MERNSRPQDLMRALDGQLSMEQENELYDQLAQSPDLESELALAIGSLLLSDSSTDSTSSE